MACYAQLLKVSIESFLKKSQDDALSTSATESSTPSGEAGADSVGKYSVFAVAAAMYLLLSIAAADLFGSVVLLGETRTSTGSGGGWRGVLCGQWVQRKFFGAVLLASFLLLILSSASVLFYTSVEDVALVIGAASVLFIADVVSFISSRRVGVHCTR